MLCPRGVRCLIVFSFLTGDPMDDSHGTGLSPTAMAALLKQAVREHVAFRRLSLGRSAGAPVYVDAFVQAHTPLLTSLAKGNPDCQALFAPAFFLYLRSGNPQRVVDPALGLASQQAHR